MADPSSPGDRAGKNMAKKAMSHWMSNTCLKFSPRKRERAYIEFQYDGWCRAQVGYTRKARQKVSIGSTHNYHERIHIRWSFGVCSALLCLAEGKPFDKLELVEDDMLMTKEQKRGLSCAPEWTGSACGLKGPLPLDSGKNPLHLQRRYCILDLTETSLWVSTSRTSKRRYDYRSIMHYSKYQGQNKLYAVVIEPREKGARIGQRIGLSAGDIRQTKLMYKCNAQGDSELQPVNDEDEDEDGGEIWESPLTK
ncbi:predicted protein [Nematostella vectensis]|uniref:Peptidase M12A domain-containing protein n=1 Tax=Nematostella vectensis TaxID=45351 RepID=A7SHE0_NEMVE|nr:predicted protein [Nematostella vectensis]|eukprot:XP_001628961.1 predicted protein [Nematostella vectensis]